MRWSVGHHAPIIVPFERRTGAVDISKELAMPIIEHQGLCPKSRHNNVALAMAS